MDPEKEAQKMIEIETKETMVPEPESESESESESEEETRRTRVITLDPRATLAGDLIAGLEDLLHNLRAEFAEHPDLAVRFEIDDDPEDEKAPDNKLAKALDEQKDIHDPSLVNVSGFSAAVQTAMRKNGIKNIAWVVVVPPDDKPGAQPRFLTGGTDNTHAWMRESFELAAAVRVQYAQQRAAGMQGMKALQSGLVVPDDKVVAPARPKLLIPE